jgi:demethylmenaquinone methyltransferase / 2-methoxy-6-polyprenyl-1,4-benzoquinol methylase
VISEHTDRGRVIEGIPAGGNEKARRVRAMFDDIAPRYDLVNRVMTFGMDVGWRRRTVRALRLPGRSFVLDLACGTGDLCRELETEGYRCVGVDFSGDMLAAAARRTTTTLLQADVTRLPLAGSSADGATCGFALRNVASIPDLFDELARVVRPRGRVALLEASMPGNVALRAGHRLYFDHVVPLVGGILSDRSAYRYLPASMAFLPPPAETVAMLDRAGFRDARRLPLSGGVAQLFVGTRR